MCCGPSCFELCFILLCAIQLKTALGPLRPPMVCGPFYLAEQQRMYLFFPQVDISLWKFTFPSNAVADPDKITMIATSTKDAMLVERMIELLDGNSKIQEMLQAVVDTNHELVTKISLMHQQMGHNEEKTTRLFKLADSHTQDITSHAQVLNLHAFIWKTIGTASLACLGLVGWGYSTLAALHNSDNETERRLTIMEYIVNGREQPIKPKVEK